VDEVVLTGGGARNPSLVRAIEEELQPLPVRGREALGLDPAAREAAAFAVLAWAHRMGLAGNAPEATGAAGPRVLGSYTPGRRTGPA
jgi:anhydro-N-acetylmuramic acid kinase